MDAVDDLYDYVRTGIACVPTGMLPELPEKVEAIKRELRERFVELPTDRNGKVVMVGSKVRLLHNGNVRTVTDMSPCGNGQWRVYGEHGGWLMPQSKDNVEVIDG